MASIYKRPDCKFFWIKYHDPARPLFNAHGKRVQRREPTEFRHDLAADVRRAHALKAAKTAIELAEPVGAGAAGEFWDAWVVAFLEAKYRNAATTLIRAKTAWRSLRMFLAYRRINRPRELKREHAFEYLTWRAKPDRKAGKYRASHNTARLELIFLSIVMDEAVLRHYAAGNPLVKLGIKRDEARIRPEFTQAVLDEIAAAIEREKGPYKTMLRNSFWIARWHGRRFAETYLNPMKDVVYDAKQRIYLITFRNKGGKLSTKKLHDELVPLFERLRAARVAETFPYSKRMSRVWHDFLKRVKDVDGRSIPERFPNACFHSLRVTVISRMARNRVPQRDSMEYVDHASTEIHRAYRRVNAKDLADCEKAVR